MGGNYFFDCIFDPAQWKVTVTKGDEGTLSGSKKISNPIISSSPSSLNQNSKGPMNMNISQEMKVGPIMTFLLDSKDQIMYSRPPLGKIRPSNAAFMMDSIFSIIYYELYKSILCFNSIFFSHPFSDFYILNFIDEMNMMDSDGIILDERLEELSRLGGREGWRYLIGTSSS